MTRRFLNAKLHQATVTETNIEYEGSLTIDLELMEKVGIRVFEQVDVYNITRGTRFTTYAIQGNMEGVRLSLMVPLLIWQSGMIK